MYVLIPRELVADPLGSTEMTQGLECKGHGTWVIWINEHGESMKWCWWENWSTQGKIGPNAKLLCVFRVSIGHIIRSR